MVLVCCVYLPAWRFLFIVLGRLCLWRRLPCFFLSGFCFLFTFVVGLVWGSWNIRSLSNHLKHIKQHLLLAFLMSILFPFKDGLFNRGQFFIQCHVPCSLFSHETGIIIKVLQSTHLSNNHLKIFNRPKEIPIEYSK